MLFITKYNCRISTRSRNNYKCTFESGDTSGWIGLALTLSANNTKAHSGTYSCKINSSTDGHMEQSTYPAVSENTDYWYSLFLWVEDTDVEYIRFYVHYRNSTGSTINTDYFDEYTLTAGWQTLNYQLTTPATTINVRIGMSIYIDAAYELWIDDVSFNSENQISEFTSDILLLVSFSISCLALIMTSKKKLNM